MIDGILPPRSRPANQSARPTTQLKSVAPKPAGFKSPEEVAAAESRNNTQLASTRPLSRPLSKTSKPKRRLSRKQLILILIAALLLLISGSVAAFIVIKNRPVAAPVTARPQPPVAKKAAQAPVIYSTLSGLPTTEALNKLPVTAVVIENSREARPQSGLNQAGVVFEAIAEGGITRFMALYQETQPEAIGPVRSVRPYYLNWMQAFDASIAHVGGSPEALALIKSAGLKDLDQYSNGSAYTRSKDRFAPHNVYTSRAKLLELQASKGFTASSYTGFVRKAEKPSAAPTAKSINLAISSTLYNVAYDYDSPTNSYKRLLAGQPHIDQVTKTQLNPKVVIGLVVPYAIQSNGLHSNYQTVGNGKAYIFQDGSVTEGVWEKSSPTSQIKFGDANGLPLGLNAGQAWITAVSAANKVTYKP